MKGLILLFIIFFAAQPLSGQSRSDLTGNWKGQIDVPNKSLPFKTHFQKQGNDLKGTVDIQGVTLPLQKINTTNNDSVFFEFQAGPGLAKFKGSFQDDSTIKGTFHQIGLQFPFTLHRYKPTLDTTNSKAALPYHHKDLVIKSDSLDIAGTLTRPKDQRVK